MERNNNPAGRSSWGLNLLDLGIKSTRRAVGRTFESEFQCKQTSSHWISITTQQYANQFGSGISGCNVKGSAAAIVAFVDVSLLGSFVKRSSGATVRPIFVNARMQQTQDHIFVVAYASMMQR